VHGPVRHRLVANISQELASATRCRAPRGGGPRDGGESRQGFARALDIIVGAELRQRVIVVTRGVGEPPQRISRLCRLEQHSAPVGMAGRQQLQGPTVVDLGSPMRQPFRAQRAAYGS
jgi:hypothetical protein